MGQRGTVRTVLGDVSADELGATYCHEHLLTRPGRHFTGGDEDLVLDDEAHALEELRRFASAGGGAIVDCTTQELGRDARALRRLAVSAGIHVVAVTGHITPKHWTGVVDVGSRSVAQLAERFTRDLTEGMDGSDVRAGAVKIGTSDGEILPVERRVMEAAARAHEETGAPVTTHTTAGTVAVEQAGVLIDLGIPPDAICVGHLDRRLVWEEHLELARTGVYLGYDCLGKTKYQPDERRIAFVVRLVDAGFADRLCLGGDMARRSYLEAWGGARGYRWILEEFAPRLAASGLSEGTVKGFLELNPARHLTWR